MSQSRFEEALMRGRVRGAGFSDNAGAALALFGGVSVSVATMVDRKSVV